MKYAGHMASNIISIEQNQMQALNHIAIIFCENNSFGCFMEGKTRFFP